VLVKNRTHEGRVSARPTPRPGSALGKPAAAAWVAARDLERPRAPWRGTGRRILAFRSAPPGTSSAEFNRRAT